MNTQQDNKIIRPKKVLLLSVSTGEGHNSAARAIAEVLRQRNIECEIVDSVEFKGKKSHSFIADGYSWAYPYIIWACIRFGRGVRQYAIALSYQVISSKLC